MSELLRTDGAALLAALRPILAAKGLASAAEIEARLA